MCFAHEKHRDKFFFLKSVRSFLFRSNAFFFLTLSFFISAFFESASRYSLVTVETNSDAAHQKKVLLVKYTFQGGLFKTKEQLLELKTKNEGEMFERFVFNAGTNIVYRNRYLITCVGNIIDLSSKKILLGERFEWWDVRGDSVILYTNDFMKGKYYSCFNLRTQKFEKDVTLPFRPRKGQDVEFVNENGTYKLWLYPPSSEKVLIHSDAGSGDPYQKGIPYAWIDGSTLVYAHYAEGGRKILLKKVSVRDRSVSVLGEIKTIINQKKASQFFNDEKKQLVYSCGDRQYKILVNEGKIETQKMLEMGDGFQVDLEETARGRVLLYKGQSIGQYPCPVSMVKGMDDHIALVHEMPFGGDRLQQGIKVWNSKAQKWKTLEIINVIALAGWMK